MACFLVLLLLYSSLSLAKENSWLAGYQFHSDVAQHSKIDLDQLVIESEDPESSKIYALGKNSVKSDGSMRSISGFSTSAGRKLENEGFFELYQKYYGISTYADKFIVSSFGGTGELRDKSASFLSEASKKGTKVLNVWMYVIHELEESINDCFDESKIKSVKHWDEGWAFYAGSMERADGSGSGVLLYALAEELCEKFQKCSEDGRSIINSDILKLYNHGRDLIYEQKCAAVIDVKIDIVKKMTVPLVQGLLHSASQFKETQMDKYHAAGLVYSRGFLPILDYCNSSAAEIISQNFGPEVDNPISDSLNLIANTLFKELKCMGITCNDVVKMDGLPNCASEGEYKTIPGTNIPSVAEFSQEEFLDHSPEPENM